jgi:hypothetical protein
MSNETPSLAEQKKIAEEVTMPMPVTHVHITDSQEDSYDDDNVDTLPHLEVASDAKRTSRGVLVGIISNDLGGLTNGMAGRKASSNCHMVGMSHPCYIGNVSAAYPVDGKTFEKLDFVQAGCKFRVDVELMQN